MSVAILTPTITGRENILQECKASVASQTHKVDHLILLDAKRKGAAAMMNIMLEQTDAEWVVPLADDDILYPNFVERLLEDSVGADVVYPWCKVIGRSKHPNWNPNRLFNAAQLRQGNYIPSTTLIRRSAVVEVGGWPDVVCEDHALWIKMLDAGKKFCCVPEILWEYRFEQYEGHMNVSDGYDPREV